MRSTTVGETAADYVPVAGFFAQSFARKLIDIDYHIAMGGRAYGTLADNLRGSIRGQAFAAVFLELAQKFQRLFGEHDTKAPSGAFLVLLEQLDGITGVATLPEIGEVKAARASADHGDAHDLLPD